MINPTLLQVFVSALGHMANKEANYSTKTTNTNDV